MKALTSYLIFMRDSAQSSATSVFSLRRKLRGSIQSSCQSTVRLQLPALFPHDSFSPPGIFMSTCNVDVRWFPFDIQKCELKFGSWTYDGWLLDLQMTDADISGYMPNGEWDLIGWSAETFALASPVKTPLRKVAAILSLRSCRCSWHQK